MQSRCRCGAVVVVVQGGAEVVQSRCRDSVEVVQMWFRGGAEQVQSRGADRKSVV